jgi:hypothetical protein
MAPRTIACVVTGLVLAAAATAQTFEKPVRLKAAGEVITTDIGHSAPYVYDFDGDGVRDLLVGQFGGGKLRIYRNAGTNKKPNYEAHQWFMAAGAIATVPAS